MRLLIVTQAVDLDDPILGFFHRWIELFAEHCESVTVICLRKGRSALPGNVRVISLGKEQGGGRLSYIRAFYAAIRAERKNYDSVFVHMNPEYVILAGWYWRMTGKRIGMWYTHKAVNARLVLATLLSNMVLTASKESFRFSSRKVHIMGHGIDTDAFVASKHPQDLRIVTVGRITPAKRLIEMLAVLDELYRGGHGFTFRVLGAAAAKGDHAYEQKLRAEIAKRPYAPSVSMGAVSNDQLPRALESASVFLHLSTTGSVDKAVLEALATGLPVVTTSGAFRDAPVTHAGEDPVSLAAAVLKAHAGGVVTGTAYVRIQHSLDGLISRILSTFAA